MIKGNTSVQTYTNLTSSSRSLQASSGSLSPQRRNFGEFTAITARKTTSVERGWSRRVSSVRGEEVGFFEFSGGEVELMSVVEEKLSL